jgi:Mg2+ and Co2+ transporter CorA
LAATDFLIERTKVADAHRPDSDLLPRSIFVPQEDPKKNLRETVDLIFSDRFMAFLSVVLIPVILIPFFVNLPDSILSFFGICDVTVIVFFVVEYLAKLYLAKSGWGYFKAPWHMLDLAVVVLSFISYIPFIRFGSRGSASLLVRLLRLPRAFAVGGRTAGSRMKAADTETVVVKKAPPMVIRRIGPDLKERNHLSWEEVEDHLGTSEQEWIDMHNITEQGVLRLSGLLEVPTHHFKVRRVDEVYPHVDYIEAMSFIFLQSGEIRYPQTAEHYFTISRRGEIIICTGPKIISASPHGLDTFKDTLEEIRSRASNRKEGFTVSVLYAILDTTLREYRDIISEVELEVARISGVQRSNLPRDFLQRMYELNKEVTRLATNLVHFKELLGIAMSRKLPLEGFEDGEGFRSLHDETNYLNDIAEDILDHLKTIIDLYINQSSFETNRILKILAVITSLAIIPSAIGGILGMNLLDTPYMFQLWQIIVIILFAMMFIGYCFVKLGWLRT